MMGSEDVLIRGGVVSVKGQLVPEGESRLLHGEDPVPFQGVPPPPRAVEGQSGYILTMVLRTLLKVRSPEGARPGSNVTLGRSYCLTLLSLSFPICLTGVLPQLESQ